MTNFNLTKDVSESFEFEIGEFKYVMRYPNGPERKKMSELGLAANKVISKAQQAQNDGDQDGFEKYVKEAEKPAEEFSKVIKSLITPQDGAPADFDAELEKYPNPVLWNFQKMLESQLSVTAPNQAAIRK